MSGAGTGPAPFPSLAAARATWLLERYSAVSVIVVGDVMLDQFVVGHVRRISPEAPVPVVEFERDEFRIGGAANVAHNLTALGAESQVTLLAFNDNIFTLARKTTAPDAKARAVQRLEPWGGTALYDVVIRGTDMLGRQIGRQPGTVAAAGKRQLQIGQRLDLRGG